MEVRDQEQWRALFHGYRSFYEFAPDEQIVDTVWGWLMDAGHEEQALVAVNAEGRVAAIAHYRRFARPSVGRAALFLDDLFTDVELRGQGIARLLLERLQEIASAEDLAGVRWFTGEQNLTAQALYNQLAVRLPFYAYEMPPAMASE